MKKITTWFKMGFFNLKNRRQKQFIGEINDSVGFKIKNGKFLLICRGIIMKEYSNNTQIKDVVSEINNILQLNIKHTDVF